LDGHHARLLLIAAAASEADERKPRGRFPLMRIH
jgi:hypothetical protein